MATQRLDTELLDSKQFTKAAKILGDKNAREVLSLNKEGLERIIVDCEMAELQVRAETRSNQNYQKAKETIADFNAGERETVAPFKVKKALAAAALKSLKDNP